MYHAKELMAQSSSRLQVKEYTHTDIHILCAYVSLYAIRLHPWRWRKHDFLFYFHMFFVSFKLNLFI